MEEGCRSSTSGNRVNHESGMIYLTLTQEEATDLFFRCLRSPDEDNPLSEIVLSKLARAISDANEDDISFAA